MLVASKYEEIYAPAIEEFCYITDNTYTREQVGMAVSSGGQSRACWPGSNNRLQGCEQSLCDVHSRQLAISPAPFPWLFKPC